MRLKQRPTPHQNPGLRSARQITFLGREERFERFRRNKDDPKSERTKRHQADKERDNHRGQHEDDLLPILEKVAAVALRGRYETRIYHQVFRYHRIEDN